MLTFVSLKLCLLGFVHRHNELFFSYMLSLVHKFISSEEIRIRADEERTPTHCLITVHAEVYEFKVTSL